MFRKLRNKMAISNGVVLLIFVISFVSIIWLTADKGLMYGVDNGLKSLSNEVEDLYKIPPIPEPDKINPAGPESVKIILRDSTLMPTAMSPRTGALETASKEIAQKAWQENHESWDSIKSDEQYIRIYSVPFHQNDENGIVQTTFNMAPIYYFITMFLTRLFVVAIIFAAIAAYIGWLLAGRAMIPIKVAWNKQEDFVADASHELRTPLTIIQTSLDAALSDPEGKIKENTKWLQNAYSETEHMGKLTNDLLLLAQSDRHESAIVKTTLDVSILLEEVAVHMKTVSHKSHLYFTWQIEPGLILHGDDGRIRQLLMILLDNAFKYTPPNGSVKLTAKQSRDKLVIAVTDSGIGFSQEETKRIFDRFYRVDKTRSRSQGGTGLGLSIAKWIVDVHKGTIDVKSTPGQGSSFTLIFPVRGT